MPGLSVRAELRSDKVRECHASAVYFSDLVFLVLLREEAVKLVLEPARVALLPRVVSKTFCEIEVQCGSASCDGFYFKSA